MVSYKIVSSFVTFVALVFAIGASAPAATRQDGSDIRYYKTSAVDKSIIGAYVQFDFYNRSFTGKTTDTVSIDIDGKAIRFIEIRTDDGFNNWFSRQSLRSVEKLDGQVLSISKFRLDGITKTAFSVTIYLDYFDPVKKMVTKSSEISCQFEKKDIVEVLVKSKQI